MVSSRENIDYSDVADQGGFDVIDRQRISNVYTIAVDVYFSRKGQRFVWDSAKAVANMAKHGVRFEIACEVFFDPLLSLMDASAEDEARIAAIGETENWKLLFVVHVQWEHDAIRVISARNATEKERREYEEVE